MEIKLDNIYNMDCLEGMKAMPDGSVDCCVTSPPYNFCLRVMGDQYKHRTEGERFGNTDIPMNKYTNGLSDSLDMEDYYKWQCECIDEMMRVTKGVVFYNVQVITGNKVEVMKILGKYAEQIRDLLIWDKKTAEPAMHFGCLNSEFELIIAFDHGHVRTITHYVDNHTGRILLKVRLLRPNVLRKGYLQVTISDGDSRRHARQILIQYGDTIKF